MRGPELDVLRRKVGNKYMLVAVTAKRARQLMNGSATRLQHAQGKPVTVALEEIATGVVNVVPPTPAEKQE